MGRSTVIDETPQLPDGQPDAGEADAPQRDPSLWQLQHGNSLAPVRLSLLRVRRSWRLLSTIGIGMLVAVTLICMVPLYSTLIANVHLRQALTSAPPSQINIATFVSTYDLAPNRFPGFNQKVEAIRQREIGAFAPNDSVSLQSMQPFDFIEFNGQRIVDARPDLQLDRVQPYAYDYDQALPHMQLLSGRLPQDVPAGQPPEVLVTPKLDAHIGDLITLSEALTNHGFFGGYGATDQQMKVRVVGIWFPKQNVTDPFWNGVNFDTVDITIKDPPAPKIYPLLFTKSALLGAFAGMKINPGVTVVYLAFTQPAEFDTSNLQLFYDRLARYRTEISAAIFNNETGDRATVATSLDKLIRQVQGQRALLELPLASVVALIVGLALLFVVIMASILIESQRGEIATLTSRGASGSQMLVSFTFQSVLLALLIAPFGLLLAYTLARLLARLFIPTSTTMLTDTLVNRVTPVQTTILLALAGVLLASLAVLLAVWQTTRLDVLAFRRVQGRGGGPPFWQRFHLDVVLIALCLVGYLELGQFGSLNARAQLAQIGLAASQNGPSGSGQGAPDPLLLIAPALLLLAGGLLVLRLFPLAARFGSWLATRERGAAGMLAFSQIARVTAQFSRLTLLLTLSVALGLFALGFDTSIKVNATQRAAYETGGDLRIALNEIASASAFANSLGTSYAHLPGVTDITPIYRTFSKVTIADESQNVGTLGIDPTSFSRVAQVSWRADYADQPLTQILDDMKAHTIGTASAGQKQHPIWVLIDDTASATLHLVPGSRFGATPFEGSFASIYFVVGAVVHHFPTLYSGTAQDRSNGNIIVSQQNLIAALQHIGGASVFGPTEYWLRTTTNSAETRQREQLLHTNPTLYAATLTDRRALAARYLSDPLNAGMGGLLLVGAALAALLAVLGCMVQSSVSASQRVTLFAILRTLGMTRRQIRALLLSEQSVVYLFGSLSGSLLGMVLATATLPFLQFSGSLQDPATLGVPPYILTLDFSHTAIFYATLLVTFVAALVAGSWIALRAGIGKVLRIGED
ncbi:MAG: FtsX-like permease family protein [Ktedonobacterales bacterium]